MPLLLLPLLLIALILGAVWLYSQVASLFGAFAGFSAVVAVIAALTALVAWQLRRYRAIHGRAAGGRRVLSTEGAWGALHLNANGKTGSLALHGNTAQFIFADIVQAPAVLEDDGWSIHLALRHQARAKWVIPMHGRKQARQWEKILSYAASQKL